jgi:hypothetical protein
MPKPAPVGDLFALFPELPKARRKRRIVVRPAPHPQQCTACGAPVIHSKG